MKEPSLTVIPSNQLFDDTEEINLKEQNLNYQKEFSNKITSQLNKTISLLTLSLNNHLKFGQTLTINISEVFMSFEKLLIDFLSNKQI